MKRKQAENLLELENPNRAQRRAIAKRVVVRRHPVTGEKANGRQVQRARSFYAQSLVGKVAVIPEAQQDPKSWVDRFSKRVRTFLGK